MLWRACTGLPVQGSPGKPGSSYTNGQGLCCGSSCPRLYSSSREGLVSGKGLCQPHCHCPGGQGSCQVEHVEAAPDVHSGSLPSTTGSALSPASDPSPQTPWLGTASVSGPCCKMLTPGASCCPLMDSSTIITSSAVLPPAGTLAQETPSLASLCWFSKPSQGPCRSALCGKPRGARRHTKYARRATFYVPQVQAPHGPKYRPAIWKLGTNGFHLT